MAPAGGETFRAWAGWIYPVLSSPLVEVEVELGEGGG